MESKRVTVARLSQPTGGGAIRGIGETFQPNGFTGSASLSIPLHTSPCRGAEPKLSLDYSSGAGNGVFGLGFALAIPNVARKTEKGIPLYGGSDTFLLSNADDLVPAQIQRDGRWEPEPPALDADGDDPSWVRRFCPRTEGLFARIEQRTSLRGGNAYWRVTTRDNAASVYGRSANAWVSDPDDPTRVYQWLIEETVDAKGNRIHFEYRPEVDRALSRILYGDYLDAAGNEQWHFELVFDYGERSLGPLVSIEQLERSIADLAQRPRDAEPLLAPRRKDPFSSFRAGFEIRTEVLCRAVLMFHRFDGERFLVHCTHFNYAETPYLSQLTEVTQVGVRKDPDGYRSKALPSLSLSYSASAPLGAAAREFKPLTADQGNGVPGILHQPIGEMVDLYGEGLPGILYSDDRTTLYWRAQGDGAYELSAAQARFPNYRDLASGRFALLDLERDGQLELVVPSAAGGGYFQGHSDGTWEPFQTFASCPLDALDPDRQMADMTGDGLADLVLFEASGVKVYPSQGRRGFGPATVERRADELPVTAPTSRAEAVCFADMFGDGGSHVVRIRNGSVECWPHLGYGRFGRRIALANAPRFGDEFDAARLFLADLDGSGTADLVYACRDRLEIYRNQSGNGFGECEILPLPHPFDNGTQIHFADVLGNGSACLVLTTRQAGLSLRHDYFDFAGGTKPHLLVGTDNNMGAVTRIQYAPSTRFYLADQRAGTPWRTHLHFPVQVVESTEAIDEIAGTGLVTRYAYHDGYFDPVEREFRGFGHVEQWDAESLKQPAAQEEGGAACVAPVYTRIWYHTGAPGSSGQLSAQYKDDYYQGDAFAHRLPDSTLEGGWKDQPPEGMREAYRALHGRELRREVYGDDAWLNPELARHPYAVTESSFTIRLIQPSGQQPYAVCFAYPRESLSYHYERDPSDPRIAHGFTLAVDDFGHVLESCDFFYPRRDSGAAAEQRRPRALATLSRVENVTPAVNAPVRDWLLGVPVEERTFELGGLARLWPPDGSTTQPVYLSISQVEQHVREALVNPIRFGQSLSDDMVQARLVAWDRHIYWDSAREPARREALPLGEVTARELLHHTASAVFSVEQVEQVFASKLTEARVREGGYILEDGYWWNPGLTQHYLGVSGYFLPSKQVDVFGAESAIEYDDYQLMPIQATDALGNITSVEIDYYALEPQRLTDANGNHSEARFDPLGMVVATSIYGTEDGRPAGDLPLKGAAVLEPDAALILGSPGDFLLDATAYFFYDYSAWQKRRQPPHAIALYRETHVHDLTPGTESPVQVHIAYVDGFGRALQSKSKAGPDRWLTSGRTVYNNKGGPVKQWEPFYSATADYEADAAVTQSGVTTVHHYDPLLRVVRIDAPDGSFAKVRITPWREEHFDANDTVLDATFADPGDEGVPQEDRDDALRKAARHSNTPDIHLLDNLGHAFLVIQQLKEEPGQVDAVQLTTYHGFDILGHELFSIDPRLYGRFGTKQRNIEHDYDMLGATLKTVSTDGGTHWVLHNAGGNPIHVWDSRNFHIGTLYDRLQRPLERRVQGDDENGLVLDHVVERMVYGESAADAREHNLRGKMVEHFDQAGVERIDNYSIHGLPRGATRQLRQDYRNEAGWDHENEASLLEEERFTSRAEHDALGRLVREFPHDGSTTARTYRPEGWLRGVTVTFADGTTEPVVANIDYNAKGQRTGVLYGNGVTTTYNYERTTFRLIALTSVRERDGAVLQEITYAHDPVGNITRIRDHSCPTVIATQEVVEPLSDFTYDSLYRLRHATGREHPAIGGAEDDAAAPDALKRQRILSLNDLERLRGYTETYSYDSAGNRIGVKHQSGDGGWTQKAQMDATSNRMLSSVQQGVTTERRYDAQGNLSSLEGVRGLHWNYRGNLACVDLIRRGEQPQDREFYVYDGSGRRIRKVSETLKHGGAVVEISETIYLGSLDIQRVRQQADGGVRTTLERLSLQVTDESRRLAVAHQWRTDTHRPARAGKRQLRYLLDNHLGSVAMELSAGAELISYEEYYPYGGTALMAGRDQTEVDFKRYRYSGKERDGSTGLYYYGARYYAPWLGRWIAPDPAGAVDGLNLYAFVGNNPILFSDCTGLVKTVRVHGQNRARPLSHGAMNARFENIGDSLGQKLITLKPSLSTISKLRKRNERFRQLHLARSGGAQKDHVVRSAIEAGLLGQKKQFGESWRAAHPGMDEQFSTSSVFRVLKGIGLHQHSISPHIKAELVERFTSISYLRMPTGMTGYHTVHGTTQHPAAAGMFGPSGKNHGTADLLRKELVLRKGESAGMASGRFGPLDQMALTAAQHTLNFFAAPATASNVSTLGSVPHTQVQEQMLYRETGKVIGESIGRVGGVPMTQPKNKPWSPVHDAPFSPSRAGLTGPSVPHYSLS
jgi:RHS repeat-associated protein